MVTADCSVVINYAWDCVWIVSAMQSVSLSEIYYKFLPHVGGGEERGH